MNKQEVKDPCLSFWFQSDFAGCGQLRTIIPNNVLNAVYAHSRKKTYEGIVSSRMHISERLFDKIKIVHFQRQTTDAHLEFLELVRDIKEKVPSADFKIVYDLDDLIGEVPSYNFASKTYNNPKSVENLKRVTNLVDVFTVSTHPLKKKIEALGGSCKVKIVPNYLAKYMYRPYDFIKKENKKPRIMWAGSPTHFNQFDKGDFGVIFDLIRNTVDEFEWVILGIRECPPWLKPFEDKIEMPGWESSMYRYPSLLKELNCDFGVAPLLNNWFNQCKSSIKHADYCSADIISICSKLTPYRDAELFFSGDWKIDRDTIIDIFQNKQKKEEILHKQNKWLDKQWMETAGVKKYREVFGF